MPRRKKWLSWSREPEQLHNRTKPSKSLNTETQSYLLTTKETLTASKSTFLPEMLFRPQQNLWSPSASRRSVLPARTKDDALAGAFIPNEATIWGFKHPTLSAGREGSPAGWYLWSKHIKLSESLALKPLFWSYSLMFQLNTLLRLMTPGPHTIFKSYCASTKGKNAEELIYPDPQCSGWDARTQKPY